MDHILKRNFTYLFILQNVNYVIPLLLLPYLTRTLGAENFGKISFVQAIVAYFILLTEFGFNTSSTQEIVGVRDDREALSKVFWSTTFTKALFAVCGFIVMEILILSIPRLQEMSLLLMIAFGGVVSSVLFPVWLFQGLEKMSYITWFNVIPRILVLVFTFLFVKLKSDYLLALFIQTVGTFLSALACSLLIYQQSTVKFYLPELRDIKSAIIEGWHIFISGVATNFYTTTNTVVLGFLTNDATVGIFSASEKIIRAIISLFSSITQVTFPRINTYYRETKEMALRFGGKLLLYSGILTFTVGILLFALAPILVKLLFGLPQYRETINILRISSFLPFFAICNGILAVNILVTFGLKRYLVKVTGYGGLFSILLIFPFVMCFQARGVAICALLTEMLISALLFSVFKKHQIILVYK